MSLPAARPTVGWRLVQACATALAATAVVTAEPVQQAGGQTRPVFRGDIALVPVDVRVVDKAGRPVTDLTQSDFTIFENGVRQELRHFSKQVLTAQTPPANPSPLPRRSASTGLSTPPDYRVFLLVLGRGNLRGPSEGIRGLIHLVRDRLLPQDRVAVMSWNRATDFTTDHARILEILERFQREQIGIDERLRRYQSGLVWLYGNREIPPWLQQEIDALFGGGVGTGIRSVTPAIMQRSASVQNDLLQTIDVLQSPGLADPASRMRADALSMSFDQFTALTAQTIEDTNSLYSGIEYLRHIDGEKHLIWLQEYGVYYPRVEDDRSLGRTASDGRVALSIIRAGGTASYSTGLGEARSLPRGNAVVAQVQLGPSATSRAVAEMSGGRYDANRPKNASDAADLIEQASRVQYQLGYYPASTSWDGRYRQIRIEVTRPGVTALYRHGYFARQELPALDRQGLLSYSRISSAAGHVKPIPDIRLTAGASMKGQGADAEVLMDVTVDLARVQFEAAGGSHTATIEFGIFCLDRRQQSVGELWKRVELTLTDERRQQLVREGLVVRLSVPVTAAADSVKVVAYDYGADLIGSANVKVTK